MVSISEVRKDKRRNHPKMDNVDDSIEAASDFVVNRLDAYRFIFASQTRQE